MFFNKELTWNPEVGNTTVWVLPNIWTLDRVMGTKFGTNVSNRMLLNAAKFQCYSFYRFWIIEKKSIWGGRGEGKITPTIPTEIRVNIDNVIKW